MREATVAVLGDGKLASAIAWELGRGPHQPSRVHLLSVRHGVLDAQVAQALAASSGAEAPAPVVVVAVPKAQGGAALERQNATAQLVGEGIGRVLKHSRDAVMVVATSPVGAMCEVARRVGAPPAQVLGVAGGVATASLRRLIAQEVQVPLEDVAALVVGGGGGGLIPLRHCAAVAGVPARRLLPKGRLDELVHQALAQERSMERWEERDGEPATLAAATAELVNAVVADSHRILPCAAYLTGEFGLEAVWAGVPCLVGARGVCGVFRVPLTSRELHRLFRSAKRVQQRLAQLPWAVGSA
ncbi:MAG: hypothetical protein HXY19_09260 [Thermoanaerobaculaceae bacterium]|nr:hypothetical protein [Thermoanaerobaculaceae bacterium]